MDKSHGDFPPHGALASSTPKLLKDQLKLRGICGFAQLKIQDSGLEFWIQETQQSASQSYRDWYLQPNWVNLEFLTYPATAPFLRNPVLQRYLLFVVLLWFSHSVVSDSATPGQASLSLTISQSLLKALSIELMMPSNHLILCHPLLLLPSTFPSIRDFSSKFSFAIKSC